jgi:hypothetical protein
MEHSKNKKQIENPVLNKIEQKKEKIFFGLTEEDDEEELIRGTNPLLWDKPTYSAVDINLDDDKTENPNAYWEKWAKEEKDKQITT